MTVSFLGSEARARHTQGEYHYHSARRCEDRLGIDIHTQKVLTFPNRAARSVFFFVVVMATDTPVFANPLSVFVAPSPATVWASPTRNAHSVLGGNPIVTPNL